MIGNIHNICGNTEKQSDQRNLSGKYKIMIYLSRKWRIDLEGKTRWNT